MSILFTPEDYKRSFALSLVINQLSESPNYKSIINAIARTYDDQDKVLAYLGCLDINTAEGVWLDLIGSIVGQSRKVNVVLQYVYWGYNNLDVNAGGYLDDAIYYYTGAPDFESNLLGDDEYRRVIIAKAAKNAGDVSLPAITSTMQQVLEQEEVYVYNSGFASVTILFEGEISDNILALIRSDDIVPLGAGIGLRALLNYDIDTAFGYSDIDPNLQGYGNGEYARNIL